MSIKDGLVMEIKENAAYIMTSDGEFLKVKIDKNKTLPIVGGEYSGIIYKNPYIYISKFKYTVAACLLFFMLSLGGGAYAYYTPVSTVTISINPSIEFKLNRWNRILSSRPLNSDGEKILKEIKTKNTQIDEALVMVVNQAKEDKYIDDNYINTGKTIAVNITGKEIGLPGLEKELSKDNINVKIDSNGNTIYNKNNRKPDNVSFRNSDDKSSNVNPTVTKLGAYKNNSDVYINNKVLGNIGNNSINIDKPNTTNAIEKKVALPNLEKELSKNNANIKIDTNKSTIYNDKNANGNTNNKSLDNTESGNNKHNNRRENDNKIHNNNSNLEKSDGKLNKDKKSSYQDSDKTLHNNENNNNKVHNNNSNLKKSNEKLNKDNKEKSNKNSKNK